MEKVVVMRDIVTKFGEKVVHDGVSISVNRGEIYALLGGSGSGKSTLLNEMIMLLKPQKGSVEVLGIDVLNADDEEMKYLKHNWGVLFQSGALFSSLSVKENIDILLKENTDLSEKTRDDIIKLKINLVGLNQDVLSMYPSELSGGMIKRVALARAIALDPEVLFLDEPTSGLDPIGAREFDDMLIKLRDMLGFSVVMVTHDLQTVKDIVDRFALLYKGKVLIEGDLKDAKNSGDKFVKEFFREIFGENRV